MNQKLTVFFGIGLVAGLVVTGCTGTKDYQKSEPVTLEDLNGVYRERTSLAETSDEFEHFDYSEFAVNRGDVTYRRLDEQNLSPKETVLGSFEVRDRKTFSLKPQANLTQLANSETDVKSFQEFVTGADRIRVRKRGDNLTLTRIEGNHRTSQTWVRVAASADGTFQKATEKAGELTGARQAFLTRWKDKTLVLFEHVREVIVNTKPYRHPTLAKDKDGKAVIVPVIEPDEGSKGKKQINFVTLKFPAINQAVINENLPGTALLRLRKARGPKDPRVDLLVKSTADAALYEDADLEGVIQDDGDGLKIVESYREGNQQISEIWRYQPEGVTTMKPTPATDPTDPPAARDDEQTTPARPQFPPRRRNRQTPPSRNGKFPGVINPPRTGAPAIPGFPGRR